MTAIRIPASCWSCPRRIFVFLDQDLAFRFCAACVWPAETHLCGCEGASGTMLSGSLSIPFTDEIGIGEFEFFPRDMAECWEVPIQLLRDAAYLADLLGCPAAPSLVRVDRAGIVAVVRRDLAGAVTIRLEIELEEGKLVSEQLTPLLRSGHEEEAGAGLNHEWCITADERPSGCPGSGHGQDPQGGPSVVNSGGAQHGGEK